MPAGDDFGALLAALAFRSQLYFRAELSSPFALAVPAAPEPPGAIRFHVVAAGRCALAQGDAPPLALETGDLVLVPHGAPHVLADAHAATDPAACAPTPLDTALRASGFDAGGPFVFGGGGARTVLVCGHFAFGAEAPVPLAGSLPSLLHVPAGADTSYAWIEQVVRHIEGEAREGRPGHTEVARRLSEILCIELLRAYATHGDLAALAALVDPQLGRALRALHAEPEAPWSLERLARTAGLSRTLFAERFRERLGASPMRYLAAVRLQKARELLARGGCSVGEVAHRVGYASESAFNRAFREAFGAPPGAWRRGPTHADA